MSKVELGFSKKIAFLIPSAILLFFLPTMSDPFNLPKLVLFAILVAGLLVSSSIDRSSLELSRNSHLTVFALYGLLLLFMILSTISSDSSLMRLFMGAQNRNNGLLYYLLCISACVLLLIQRYDIRDSSLFFRNIAIASTLFLAYCALQLFNFDPVNWNNPYNRIIGTVGNPNFSATVLACICVGFLLSLRVAISGSSRLTFRNLALFMFGILSAFLSYSTDSLQGNILILFGISLALVRYFFMRFGLALKISVLALMVSLGALAFISFAGIGPLGQSLAQYTLRLRFIYASIGIKGMLEAPIFGLGADRYLDAFFRYRSEEFIQDYSLSTITNNAHSVPVQIGSGFGVIAFLLYLSVQGIVTYFAVQNILFKREIERKILIISVVFLMLQLQSLISIEQIGLGVMMWMLGAFILRESLFSRKVAEEKKDAKVRPKNRSVIPNSLSKEASVLVMALLLWPSVVIFNEDQAWKNIVFLQYKGEEDNQFISEQYSKLSTLTLYEPRRVGPMLENLFNSGNQQEVEDLIYAMADENDVYTFDLKVVLLIDKGELSEAHKAFSRMMALDPNNYVTALRKAELEIDLGLKSDAAVSLRQVLEIAPDSPEAGEAANLLKNL